MKKADLKKVAEALNKVLELDEEDQIDTDLKPKELEKELKKCVGGESPELDIYEEDEFSEEAWELLAELGNETAMKRQEEAEDEEAEEEDEDEDNDEEGEVEEEKGTEEEEEEEKEEETEGYTWEEINTMKKKDLVKIIKEDDLDIDPNKYPKLKDLKEAVFEEVGVEEDEDEAEEEETEEEQISWDDIDAMKKKELKEYIEDNELEVDPDDYKKIADLKKAVWAEVSGEEIEEEEPEEPEPPKKTKKKEEKKPEKKEKKESKKTENKPGVIDSILEFIKKSSKKGITKEEILEKLIERFPDRPAKGMAHTINAQIGGKQSPCRLERTKDVQLKVKNGKYSIK